MYLPHDGDKRAPDSLVSFAAFLTSEGFTVKVLPRAKDLSLDTQKVRTIFPRLWFNIDKTESLIESLISHRREWDEPHGCFKDYPVHDWTSHYISAVRGLANAIEIADKPQQDEKKLNKQIEEMRARRASYNFLKSS
jgi:hypothetical protein